MTRSLREYLREPNKLFRRVRDERGVLQLSKAAKDYHPGRGVYRSSYKNARRLAATETNIAYRTSDHLRWQQADYVVGIEVKLSNNHTVRLQPGETTADPSQLRKDGTPKTNAVRPLHDICDELQGRYPKDFKFTGWHPHCRCYAISILKTEKERLADLKRIARGEPLNSESVNAVHDTPEAFNEWIKNNADRINQSKSLPYFIRDNQQRVDRLLGKQKTPQEIAKERHEARTSEGIEDIKNKWQARKNLNGGVAKLIDDTLVPEMNYHSEMPKRATLKDKLDNAIRGGIYYQGEGGVIASGFSSCLGKTYDKSTTQILMKRLSENYFYREHDIVELPTIEHLMELRKFKDVDKIHPTWRKRYNELIDELNAYDYKKGVRDIVPKIEEAHNIMKLSTNTKALGFGLGKLSHRTPYQIFDEFEKVIPGFSKSCPKKEFFDAFPEYIPLFTGSEAGNVAHFLGVKKHVVISVKGNCDRLTNSVWERDGVFYHEYGHAYDYLNKLRSDMGLKKLYREWKNKVIADNGVALENKIKAKLKPYQDAFDDWWDKSEVKRKCDEACKKAHNMSELKKASNQWAATYTSEKQKQIGDVEEQIGALSDCLNAFINGSRTIRPRCHMGNYFAREDSQLAEFIAHCSECFWGDNKYFKELAPELYDEMAKWAKIEFKQ